MFNFGTHLKSLRRSRNLTQKQLALAIGASESGIQNYELGTRKPTYDMLVALADYFDVPVDFLLGRGLFANWDIVLEYQDQIFASIESLYPFPADFKLSALPEGKIMRLVAALIERVELVEDKLNIYYLI